MASLELYQEEGEGDFKTEMYNIDDNIIHNYTMYCLISKTLRVFSD